MTMNIIRINNMDQVVVAPKGLKRGETIKIAETEIRVLDDIPACHKMAIRKIMRGEQVLKYGCPYDRSSRNVWG